MPPRYFTFFWGTNERHTSYQIEVAYIFNLIAKLSMCFKTHETIKTDSQQYHAINSNLLKILLLRSDSYFADREFKIQLDNLNY